MVVALCNYSGGLRTKAVRVATLQNHSGILNSTMGLNAAKPQRTLLKQPSRALLGAVTHGIGCPERRSS